MGFLRLKLGMLKGFNFLFIIVFGYVFLNTVVRPLKYFHEYNQMIILFGAAIIMGLLLLLSHYLNKLNSKRLAIISISSFIMLIGLQLFCAYYFRVNPTWDFGEVYNEARELSVHFRQINHYFYLYCPNNLPILLVITGLMNIFQALGFNDMLIPLIGINLVVVWLAVLVMYLLIKELYGLKRATLFSLISLFVTPFYLYTTIVYTDTLGMIFPILGLYLYVKIYKKENYDWFTTTLLGFLIGMSALFKTHAAIILIAILIHYFITNRTSMLKFSANLLVPVLVILMGYQLIIRPIIPITSEEVGFPKTHWIMMGLKGTGGFDDEDTDMTRYLKDIGYTNEQIQNEHLLIMKERIHDFGISGLVKHLNDKLNFTWSEGTYFAPEKLKREPLSQNIYQTYIFGENNTGYLYMSQMIHVVIQFLVLVSAIGILKKKTSFESVATISLFGVILFLLIWETRSRYLMIYLPVIVFLASHGFGVFSEWVGKIKRQ